jgi:hypothetical protein
MPGHGFLTRVGRGLKKIGELLLGLLALIVLGALGNLCSQILPSGEPTPTVYPTPTMTAEASIRGNIVDLLEQGVIEVEPRGSGIDDLELAIRRLLEELIEVEIPVGTLFVAESTGTQNMVVRRQVNVVISWDGWDDVEVPVACANKNRSVPRADDSFHVVTAAEQAELQELAATIEERASSWGWEYSTFDVVQAEIWIVTDDASYGGLGTLVRQTGIGGFGTRAIDEDETVRAMRLVDEAGIDITTRRIWQDRDLIAAGAEDGSLVEWLRQRDQGDG